MALTTAEQAKLDSLLKQSDALKASIAAYHTLSSPTPEQSRQKNLDVRSLDTVVSEIFVIRADQNPAGAAFIGTLAVGGSITPPNVAAAATVALAAQNVQNNIIPSESTTPATTPASEVTNSEPIKASTETNKKRPPLPNPLLAYPSYTYGLSLAMLTVDEYNKVMDNTKNYQSNRVIIASAGRYNNDTGVSMFKRAPFFNEDFYFENLDMTTIIGFNDHSRATNAIAIKFTIVEPYGITLMNRIIDLSTEIKSPNYISQPYLLQIDFFGSNDAGEIIGIIPDQTKRIPIRLNKLEVKAGPKGAEYQIEATPYNHSAWDVSSGTPLNVEVTAGDIVGFFENDREVELLAELKANRELQSTTIIRAAPTAGENGRTNATIAGRTGNLIGPEGQLQVAPSLLMSKQTTNVVLGRSPLYKVKSYGGAVNAFYADLANTGQTTIADKYLFKIHPDIIAEGGFNLNVETLSTAQTPMASEENRLAIRGSADTSIDHSIRILPINAGTSIDQVITIAMRHTHYLQGQLKPKSEFGTDIKGYNAYLKKQSSEPLKWFKIVPVVKLLEYNLIEERWAREITYHILPYTVYNTKIPTAPQGVWTNPCKVHNYWYTGKNNDVLDLTIEFNYLYYTAITAYKENLSRINNLSVDKTVEEPLPTDEESRKANAIALLGQKPTIGDMRQNSGSGAITKTAQALADVESSLYTTSSGDMMQAKLKIIGDPQYIKQDDVFYAPVMTPISDQADSTGIDPRLIANGSLHMDQGEIYIQVTVKSPVDLDESTGMMNFDPKYKTSVFSGMWRLLKVESSFTGGKFEQILDIVRLPRQTSLEPTNAVATDNNNRETTAKTTLSTDVDTSNSGPDFSAKTTGDDKAPGSNPVTDTTPPLQTAEEKALAKVDATAPETPITTSTEPVAVPPPPTQKTIGDIAASNLEIKRNISSFDALITTNQNALLGARGTLDILKLKSADASAIAAAQGRINELQNTIKSLNLARTELVNKSLGK